jgi:hypothetical protein
MDEVGQDTWNQRFGTSEGWVKLDSRILASGIGSGVSGLGVHGTVLRLAGDVAAAADFLLLADDAGDGFALGDVLLGEDALGKGVVVIRVEN